MHNREPTKYNLKFIGCTTSFANAQFFTQRRKERKVKESQANFAPLRLFVRFHFCHMHPFNCQLKLLG